MTKLVVPLSEVPDNFQVHEYLMHKFSIRSRFSDMPYQANLDPVLKFKVNGFDHQEALKSVKEAASIHGWWGFLSHFEDTRDIIADRATYYGGFSLTHNPDISYAVPEHASALGEPKVNLHDFFQTDLGRGLWLQLEERHITPLFYKVCFGGGLPMAKQFLLEHGLITGDEDYDWNKPFTSKNKTSKNGYFDTYSFRKLTAAGKFGYHGDFIQSKLKRSMCRSRAAYINGSHYQEKTAEYMWHYDENLFMCLRINVPLQTTPNYFFEIKDEHVGQFEPGYIYTWNTQKVHRVYAAEKEDSQRIHLVMGICPWFDYDEEQDAYISNEFFGEMHPFDMVAQGHVFEGTTLA